MGKLINKIKNWFKRKTRLEERYTLNRKYLGRSGDLKQFLEKRQSCCDYFGIKLTVIEDDNFPDHQYGYVELVDNGKVIESALLKKGDLGLVRCEFYGNKNN